MNKPLFGYVPVRAEKQDTAEFHLCYLDGAVAGLWGYTVCINPFNRLHTIPHNIYWNRMDWAIYGHLKASSGPHSESLLWVYNTYVTFS